MAMNDLWLKDQEDLEKYGNELMYKINVRNQQPKSGLQFTRLEGQINLMLKKFKERIQNLQERLNNQTAISPSEKKRRQSILDDLNTRLLQMENTLKNPSANTRSQLMGAGLPEASNGQTAETSSPDELRQMTKQLKTEQDKGLDILDEIISRQKGLVVGIGNQITVQNELIDDIGDHMESTHVKLVRTTRNVERVSKKANSCCYWIIIILLLIAIVVVACL